MPVDIYTNRERYPAFFCPTHFPLKEKDRFGEFKNPHQNWTNKQVSNPGPTPAEVVKALETLPDDYYYSVCWIRALRPKAEKDEDGEIIRDETGKIANPNNGLAHQFWSSPLARAHVMNALLCRGVRSVATVQADLDFPSDKLYQYFGRWEILFADKDSNVTVRNQYLHWCLGKVQEWHNDGTATIVIDGLKTAIVARYDQHRGLYQYEGALPSFEEQGLLSVRAAALVLDMTPKAVAEAFEPFLRGKYGIAIFREEDLHHYREPRFWRMSAAKARRKVNLCNCMYWEYVTDSCGLRNTLPGSTKFYATQLTDKQLIELPLYRQFCEDYHANLTN